MLTNQELVKLWSNDQKRRAFVQNYKPWGVWFIQPELDLTFYKYDLPGNERIIAMEYLRAPYSGEKPAGTKYVVNHKFYLRRDPYFNPMSVSEGVIAERLKEIKEKLTKEAAA